MRWLREDLDESLGKASSANTSWGKAMISKDRSGTVNCRRPVTSPIQPGLMKPGEGLAQILSDSEKLRGEVLALINGRRDRGYLFFLLNFEGAIIDRGSSQRFNSFLERIPCSSAT